MTMEKQEKTLIASIAAHFFTIIPAFMFCWEFGLAAMVFWIVVDIIYYVVTI